MVYVVEPNNILRKENKPDFESLLNDEYDELVVQRKLRRYKESVRVKKMNEYEASRMPYKSTSYYGMTKLAPIESRSEPGMNAYNIFTIPKKDGGRRVIEEPNQWLKMNQNNSINKLIKISGLNTMRSANAFAFAKDRNTLSSLKRHQYNNSRWFLKLDIHHFFESTTKSVIMTQLHKIWPYNQLIDRRGLDFKCRIGLFLLDGRLPQGAPSSPAMSNLIMIPFDYEFSEWCREKGYIYTRYADDMLISAKDNFNWREVKKKVEELFNTMGYGYQLNEEKTRYGSRAGRNWNLGLMLNNENKITVGWRQKKTMKAMLTRIANGEETDKEKINGLLSYYKMVEPEYFKYLTDKYSAKFNVDLKQLLTQ